ncbi:MAG: helix-turn-helix transcriptional regulator [Bacteroidetes bacterium]|nr:helix-turn-helix transcriptional regulator [Bacteroidota bacterium]
MNWSQKKLAEKMGVSPQVVDKWVRAGVNFTVENKCNYAVV